jgi:hypothetical protein
MTDKPTDQIYFAVTVTRRRAEFLQRMIEVPLCDTCGREQDECDADPCGGIMSVVANCNICYRPFKSSELNEAMICKYCETRPCVG